MLTSERKALILKTVRRDGRLVAKEFSRQLGLSEDTIRRDLREMAGEGLLQRVHGGALPASPATAEYGVRQTIETDAKARLGAAAARLVRPGQVVFLDGGTTNVQLARQLPPDLEATVVTHSPSVAVELARHPRIEVELIGGRLFKHSVVAMGAACIETLGRIRADLFVMGATGVHAQAGASTGQAEEAALKRFIVRQSAETIVLATRDKLGAASPFGIVPLAEISSIIVERDLPDLLLAPLRKAGPEIVVA
ncbi:DeoR/GlpR family DNA-binding transcription regulator [Aureimonas phyllosphaerae]|uniref:DeoR/GlpR family transcriptional regulator of sugar metabolism n=1 Tax=Aureimonas phyllosphaerae TaxID=1166078 RepID=A0A7W6FTC5_9HYPH|nr:DeoR/GlpR family DNA-binding transcription regulator [Aureimonas phyllosphaerae]MBB3934575.1 DeoR/GlpR family transcriptional regulator of sugar metabolism [Aureimonas phyllosphaerae]MBB3958209.1 DeoR/GlpR family transcriptional regulator of sugar metabolism [Aureimonas phyllosphaerae]SFE93581.1 transcriptional regulator, DeoR family [Aureimonas phyllosphaerae]